MQGCKGPHLKGVNNELLPPPNDICIQHTEPLKYINPRTGIKSSKIGNAYYHVSSACIRKKHPYFSPSLISCSEEDTNLMQPSHFKLLHDALGYVMHRVIPFNAMAKLWTLCTLYLIHDRPICSLSQRGITRGRGSDRYDVGTSPQPT